MMWFPAPPSFQDPLWQGPLSPASVEEAVAAGVGSGDFGSPFDNPPVVSIGRPEAVSLAGAFPPKDLSPFVRAQFRAYDFYLVRLACSLRPAQHGAQIDRARFLVLLLRGKDGQQPVAFDAHPIAVTQKVQRDVKVSLSPSLKLEEVEASLGQIENSFSYSELHPLVTMLGIGEVLTEWEYRAARGIRLQGTKLMHLVVKAPKGMQPGEAVLRMIAYVKGSPFPLIARTEEVMADPLFVRLWD
jgi:hypothetical protein